MALLIKKRGGNVEIYLGDKSLAERFGVHRTTIWHWLKNSERNGFPKPVKFSHKVTRWKLSDIERWESERAELRIGK